MTSFRRINIPQKLVFLFCNIIGCQFGVQLYDWDGSVLIHSFDFQENGIGVDGKLVTGGLVKGGDFIFQFLIILTNSSESNQTIGTALEMK